MFRVAVRYCGLSDLCFYLSVVPATVRCLKVANISKSVSCCVRNRKVMQTEIANAQTGISVLPKHLELMVVFIKTLTSNSQHKL